MKWLRWLPIAGCLALIAVLPGCEDAIRTYQVPYVKQRLIGGIILAPTGTWFVKLMGPADDVAANRDSCLAFIHSLRFGQEEGQQSPVKWTLPDGWDYEAGKGLRFATFHIPRQLEVTMFHFGSEGGAILNNVNRWRDQLKLDPIDERSLVELAKKEQLEGDVALYLIDMESARAAKVREVRPPRNSSDRPYEFKTPAGWVEFKDANGIATTAFALDDNGKHAKVTMTPLGGGGGGITANINRWRKEIGLPDANDEELKKDAKIIDVDGDQAILVELGRSGGDKRILAVICPRADSVWFVKMVGDNDLVIRQRPVFEAFIASLRFAGDK